MLSNSWRNKLLHNSGTGYEQAEKPGLRSGLTGFPGYLSHTQLFRKMAAKNE